VIALLACAASVAAAPAAPESGIAIREARIAMPDGVELAADLYVREGAPAHTRFRSCSNTCPTASANPAAAITWHRRK
jgi:predicted acyl esterase